MISTLDLHWLAGLLEGEGYFGADKDCNTVIMLQMNDLDVVARAATLLNGSSAIYQRAPTHGRKKYSYLISVRGSMAAGWMFTLFALLGVRRRGQIVKAIARFKTKRRRPWHIARAWSRAERNDGRFDLRLVPLGVQAASGLRSSTEA